MATQRLHNSIRHSTMNIDGRGGWLNEDGRRHAPFAVPADEVNLPDTFTETREDGGRRGIAERGEAGPFRPDADECQQQPPDRPFGTAAIHVEKVTERRFVIRRSGASCLVA